MGFVFEMGWIHVGGFLLGEGEGEREEIKGIKREGEGRERRGRERGREQESRREGEKEREGEREKGGGKKRGREKGRERKREKVKK